MNLGSDAPPAEFETEPHTYSTSMFNNFLKVNEAVCCRIYIVNEKRGETYDRLE